MQCMNEESFLKITATFQLVFLAMIGLLAEISFPKFEIYRALSYATLFFLMLQFTTLRRVIQKIRWTGGV